MPSRRRADYGLDAPTVVRNLAIVGVLLLAFSFFIGGDQLPERWAPAARRIAQSIGVTYLLTSGIMVLSSKVGKLRARDALLDRLELAANARVLDVGCGHGLLLIGAASRAPEGRAVGIDLWSQNDQGENTRDATLANAEAEGVADRVEVHDGDMCAMPFESEAFDAVASSLAIHNVKGRAARRTAIEEIGRVLRPGGRVAILDIAHLDQYADDLRTYGFREVERPRWSPWIFPPSRYLIATK